MMVSASIVARRKEPPRVTPPGSPPTLTDLRRAAYANQREWVRRAGSLDAAGHPRAVFEREGLLAVRTGTTGAIVLPAWDDACPERLAFALSWLRGEGAGDVLVWCETADWEADRFVSAHGGRESFVPRWMARRLDPPLPAPASGAATIRPAAPGDLPALLRATELPYASPWQAHTTLRLARDAPGDVALLVAVVDGEIAGRAVLSCRDTAAGRTAGVYDLGVTPGQQRRGIGRQLMDALLAAAIERGADLVTLNATPAGERLYRALGFVEVGEGQTWLVPAETIRRPPATAQVRFALAISGGAPLPDDPALARHLLPNGDTPLGHASRFDEPESARRLLTMGTVPDVAALWQLGLVEEARALMRLSPASLDIRRGTQGVTPLHIAIFSGELGFLEELLDAGASPFVRDGTWDSDAFGWAHALGNDAALAILRDRYPEGEWSAAPDGE
jgi:ribosomal protein S18 acetylase RimI-like enzyme